MRGVGALVVALVVALGCGGAPISVQVGDTKIDIGKAEGHQGESVSSPASTPASAPRATAPGQIQLVTGRGIQPMVDGQAMRATGSGFFAEVPPGSHTLIVYNLLGRQKGKRVVQVKSGRRHVLGWNGAVISADGETAASGMPAAFATTSDVVITGLLVQDASTQVTVDGRSATREGSGAFRRTGVAAGRRTVLVHAGGFDLYNGPIDVGAGGETRCSFVLGSGAWVPRCVHNP